MADDIATLGLRVDTSQVSDAKRQLDALVPSAKNAESATSALERAAAGVTRTMPLAATAERQVAAASSQIAASAAPAAKALATIEGAAVSAAAGHGKLGSAAGLAGVQIAELGHIARSTFGTLANGGSIFQALGYEMNRIVSVFTIGQAGIGGTAKAIGGMALSALTAFPLVTAGVAAVGAGFLGLEAEINRTSKVHVGFGTTVKAVFQVVRDAAWNVLKPAVDAIAPWFATAWDLVIKGFKFVGNNLIATWVTAFEAVKTILTYLPQVVGAAGNDAANAMLKGIASMVNGAIGLLNDLIDKADKIPGVNIGHLGTVEFAISKPSVQSAGDVLSGLASDAKKNFSTDYLGQAFNAIQKQAEADASAPDTTALKEAARQAAQLQKQFDDALKSTSKETADIQSQIATFGQAAGAVAEYTKRQELLNLAKENHLKLSPAEIAAVNAAAVAYGQATTALQKLKDAQAAQSAVAQDAFDATWSWASGAEKASDAIRSLTQSLMKMVSQAELLGSGPLAGIFGTTSQSGGILGQIIGMFTSGFGSGAGVATGTLNTKSLSLGAGLYHTGRGPGDATQAMRYIHPAYVDSAPRYHTGVGPNEQVAVIRNDESVLTPGQMRALGGRQGGSSAPAPEIHIHDAPAGTTVTQSRGAAGQSQTHINLPRMVDDAVSAAIDSGQSKTNRSLERRYGSRPQL